MTATRHPTSPPAAYRADTADRSAALGPHDDQWLAIASELHLAAAARGGARREGLYTALGMVIDLFGDEFIDARAAREWQDNLGYVEALMVLADVMQEAGAFHLAARLLDDLLTTAADITQLQRGRILAQRSRLEWKLGRLDEASERYMAIDALGRRIRSPELQARAAIGLGAVAQQRGSFPELRQHATRAATIATRAGLRNLEGVARYGLMIVAAKAERFSDSLREGWRILELSRGDGELEAEVLLNMGQLLLEAWHPAAARASFAASLQRTHSSRILLPALGGLALASARSGAEPTVEWSVRELWRALRLPVSRYDLAMALMEAAIALDELRRNDEAARYRDAAAGLARESGFHEVAHRAEQLAASPPQRAAPAPLEADAERVVQDLRELEPDELPAQVSYVEVVA